MIRDWLTEISPSPRSSPLRFPARSLCGTTHNEINWLEPRRVIYDHEFILIEAGTYRIEIDDRLYDCRAGDFIIIPPGVWHVTRCLESGVRHYTHFDWYSHPFGENTPVMTFSPAGPDTTLYRTKSPVQNEILTGEVTRPVIALELFRRLQLMLANEHPHEQLAARGVLLELIIRVLDQTPRPPTATHRQEELAHRVRHTLDRSFAQDPEINNIRQCMRSLGQSYEHLARAFRHQYGLTPVEYIQSLRIERARDLLRQTDLTIAHIAEQIGYQDAIYFTRLFKKHTGKSPGRYRQS